MLIEKLKEGMSPKYLTVIASQESMEVEDLIEKIISGKIVVPQNNTYRLKKPCAIGQGLRVKVNANIGTSEDYPEIDKEIEKLEAAMEAQTDTIMDLSVGGDLPKIRREIRKNCPVPLGTVPIYEAATQAKDIFGSIVEMTPDHLFNVIEGQAADGVDFITVHCGVTREVIERLKSQRRLVDIVSRGGAILLAWMVHNDSENPLYEQFDRLLDIASNYDLTLSLGDGLRPGCLADASDRAQIQELIVLGELTKICRQAGVQVMVEGPGHVPLNDIEANVKIEKDICQGAPFYVLGPIVTDVAPGYDHITSAIGGALAAYYGADFLCYVTPKEHLGLPSSEDVYEGVIASRIAAHAADVARGHPGSRDWDDRMSKARKQLDWQKQELIAMDRKKLQECLDEKNIDGTNVCTMCGEFCAMKIVSEYLSLKETPKC